MAAKGTAIQHRAPFVSLWSRDDVRTAVVDFLPTKTVAVLPLVAQPLRAAQTPLLVTAIRRRGKTTVPNPPTTRALLLFVALRFVFWTHTTLVACSSSSSSRRRRRRRRPRQRAESMMPR